MRGPSIMTTNAREPRVHPVPILSLRPTQMTVGMREVKEKRKRWREHDKKKQSDLLGTHMIPVVHGPDERYYVIDHHHLGRAMWEANVDGASLEVIANLAKLAGEGFWNEMDRQKWVHPYDDQGRKKHFDEIPHHLRQLLDDPYRSLAAYDRNAGGYDKTQKPFAEFVWADFFRTRIPAKLVKDDFDKAIQQALAYAGSAAAAKMPGYIERK